MICHVTLLLTPGTDGTFLASHAGHIIIKTSHIYITSSIKMPVRIPSARRTEVLTFGVAGLGAFAPLYMMLPGAEERLAKQTARWAPRWEKNLSFFTPHVERGIQRVTPPVARTVRKIDERLPLEKMAKRVDSNIKRGIERATRQ